MDANVGIKPRAGRTWLETTPWAIHNGKPAQKKTNASQYRMRSVLSWPFWPSSD